MNIPRWINIEAAPLYITIYRSRRKRALSMNDRLVWWAKVKHVHRSYLHCMTVADFLGIVYVRVTFPAVTNWKRSPLAPFSHQPPTFSKRGRKEQTAAFGLTCYRNATGTLENFTPFRNNKYFWLFFINQQWKYIKEEYIRSQEIKRSMTARVAKEDI